MDQGEVLGSAVRVVLIASRYFPHSSRCVARNLAVVALGRAPVVQVN